jgi:hypothetical protein
MICESFLREALRGAQLSHAFSKRQKNLLHPGQSGDMIRNRLQTDSRQTISKLFKLVFSLGSAARREA